MPAIRYPAILTLVAALTLAGNALAEPIPGSIGTVVATEDGGSYTYVQIELDGEKVWYTVPSVEIKTGEKVVAPAGMAMKAFYSKVLDRTFDTVYFAESIKHEGAPENTGALPPGHPPIQSTASACPAPTGFDFSVIERPEGGKTVAEIHQESAALSGKNIIVRGIAIKVSNDIMGKNWVHLRDGSGEPGTDDLTITTTNTVQVGETVAANGILGTDLDFGSGYKYTVLLENADVMAE